MTETIAPGTGDHDDDLAAPPERRCAAAIVHHRLLEDPQYQARRASVESFARTAAPREGLVDVTIVVHVVMQNPSRVTDAQVQSQIATLNRDFQAANPDLASVPAPFDGVVGNAQIRFRLAAVDPDGNPTTGITRTTTTVTRFFTSDEGVKFAASGGVDAWDTSRYLNMWVAFIHDPILGAILGYAQFPGGPANTDGVVIAPNAFGSGGTARAPFNLGRTATHEIGHYLDLRHIWGDRVACTGDDLIADTPQHERPNYNTPTFPRITCNNAPHGEMFMNYMDYVNDAAMFMFTRQQVERMRTALSGPRVDLIPEETAEDVDFKATARSLEFSW